MDKRKHLMLTREDARAIPAVNATRVLATVAEEPPARTIAFSDCISIKADGTQTVFRRKEQNKPSRSVKATGYDEVDLANKLAERKGRIMASDLASISDYD